MKKPTQSALEDEARDALASVHACVRVGHEYLEPLNDLEGAAISLRAARHWLAEAERCAALLS